MNKSSKDKFSLIKIIVVFVILFMFMAIYIPNLFKYLSLVKEMKVIDDIKIIENELDIRIKEGQELPFVESYERIDLLDILKRRKSYVRNGDLMVIDDVGILGLLNNKDSFQYKKIIMPKELRGDYYRLNDGFIGANIDRKHTGAFLSNKDGRVIYIDNRGKNTDLPKKINQNLKMGKEGVSNDREKETNNEELNMETKDKYTYKRRGIFSKYIEITGLSDEYLNQVSEGKRDALDIPEEIRIKNKPIKVTSIGEGAFADTQLRAVKIPEGIKRINKEAFKNNDIKSLKLPSSLEKLDDFVFQGNQNLSKVFIHDKVKLEEDSFDNGIHFKYTYDSGNKFNQDGKDSTGLLARLNKDSSWMYIDLISDRKNKYSEYDRSIYDITSKETDGEVKYILNGLVGDKYIQSQGKIPYKKGLASKIKKLDLPGYVYDYKEDKVVGITDIGYVAFNYDVSMVSEIKCSDMIYLKSIGNYAFANNELETLDLSKSKRLTQIGHNAFRDTRMKNIVLPGNIESFGRDGGSNSDIFGEILDESSTIDRIYNGEGKYGRNDRRLNKDWIKEVR